MAKFIGCSKVICVLEWGGGDSAISWLLEQLFQCQTAKQNRTEPPAILFSVPFYEILRFVHSGMVLFMRIYYYSRIKCSVGFHTQHSAWDFDICSRLYTWRWSEGALCLCLLFIILLQLQGHCWQIHLAV